MTEKRLKILVVSPDIPYPANYGGRVDVYRRLNTLKKLDYVVDFVYTTSGEEKDLKKEDKEHLQTLVRNVYFSPKNLSYANLVSIIPFQVKSRISLSYLRLEEEYDCVLLEGEYVGYILNNTTLKAKKILLRVNNIEYKFFLQQSLASFPSFNSLYFLAEGIKFYFYSKKIFKKAKNLLFVNLEELEIVKMKYGSSVNCYRLLSHFDVSSFKRRELSGFKVLFIGSLSLSSNLDGIIWYIKKVHPILVNEIKEYELLIAGSIDNKTPLNKIDILKSEKNVQLYLNVADLEDIYSQAALFINPVFKGAGIKVKTINSIQNGLPVVSTTVGVEGIGLEDGREVLIANDAQKFIESIKVLLPDKVKSQSIAENAQNYLNSIEHERLLDDIIQGIL